MKVNKENSSCSPRYDGTCKIWSNHSLKREWANARVIEVPKVWRENGKQYEVTEFSGPIITLEHDGIIKLPKGCHFNSNFLYYNYDKECHYSDKLEYY